MSAIARKAPVVARIGLGLIFFVFGLNGFLHFLPNPPMPAGPALTFMGGLMATGYFFPLLKGVEVLSGLLLLSNRFVPLALAVLAPIVVNIVAFHAVLAPGGIVLALAILAAEIYLAWAYRAAFRPMLKARVSPVEAESTESEREPVPAE
jgi:uncharacterized membrane protein YphA (DoxX/SURF4 family)